MKYFIEEIFAPIELGLNGYRSELIEKEEEEKEEEEKEEEEKEEEEKEV